MWPQHVSTIEQLTVGGPGVHLRSELSNSLIQVELVE